MKNIYIILVALMVGIVVNLSSYDFEHEYNYYESFGMSQPMTPFWGNLEAHKGFSYPNNDGGWGDFIFTIEKPEAFAKNVVLSFCHGEIFPITVDYPFVHRLKVKWGDGSGWSSWKEFGTSMNSTKTFNHDYQNDDIQEFDIEVKMHCAESGDNPEMEYFTFVIPFTIYPQPDENKYNFYNDELTSFISNGQIHKPILFIEGFDPLNTTCSADYFKLAPELMMQEFINNGYDFYMLNFFHAGRDMRDNAMSVIGAMRYIADRYDNSEGIKLMGVSMGGVISRYALAWAEENAVEHFTTMFISLDSPQRGANVNQELQQIAYNAESNAPEFLGWLEEMLSSQSARQLLRWNVYEHHETSGYTYLEGGPEHNEFYNELTALCNSNGYPQLQNNITNLCISNGKTSISGNMSPGDFMYFEGELEFLGFSIVNGNYTLFSDAFDTQPGSTFGLISGQYTNFKSLPTFLYLPPVQAAVTYEIFYDPVFIPTISSLDLQSIDIDNRDPITIPLNQLANYSPFEECIVQNELGYNAIHAEVTTISSNAVTSWINNIEYNKVGDIMGYVNLMGEGSVQDVLITLTHLGTNTVIATTNPDENGNYSLPNIFINDAHYRIKYSGNCYPETLEDIHILYNSNLQIAVLPEVYLTSASDIIYVSHDTNIQAFRSIQEAVDCLMYMEIDGTVKILPGEYQCGLVSWHTYNSHIKISGTHQDNCIIQGSFYVSGANNNENDIIENLTFLNCNNAIWNLDNGLNTIRNNIFENCTDTVVKNYSSIKLINNKFINNECQLCYYAPLTSQSPSSAYSVIKDNIFENNRTTFPLLKIEGHGTLHINDNTFSGNTLSYKGGNFIEGSILEIHSSNENTSCDIIGNVFQNNNVAEPGLSSCDGIVFIDNEESFASFDIENNDFIGNSAVSMINYNANQTSSYIGNSIFVSNNVYGDNVIEAVNLVKCDYSLFYNNNSYNGNCNFGDNIFSEIDPLLDDNNRPRWDSNFKSICIDTGDGSDSDGTPRDIGAVRAITHKYDTIELPSSETDGGWKWLSFPALDNVLEGADIAGNVLGDILDPTILDSVLTQNYKIYWDDPIWEHSNEQFLRTEGFKFCMNEEATLNISGFREPESTSITLTNDHKGNWIGYWQSETQSVNDAFGDYWDDTNLRSIKAQHWSAVRFGEEWLVKTEKGHSATLSYGDMVVINCDEEMSFSWDNSTPEEEEIIFRDTKYFTFEEQEDYIPLYVEIDPSDPPEEIGAIVEGVCVGATVVTDTINQINAYVIDVPLGDIELELYYEERAEPITLSSYKCISVQEPTLIKESISTGGMQDAYFITLREYSDLIPEVYEFSVLNYPNPFNPSTTIAYSIPEDGKVDITVYNIKGQKVKTLINGEQQAGSYKTVWNGDDSSGRKISSGIYFYKFSAGKKTIIKKMLILK